MEDKTSVIEEAKERQQAEIEFVQAAYENDEAWCGNDDDSPTIIGRRLRLASTALPNECIDLVLELVMPKLYPVQQVLEVSAKVGTNSNGASSASSSLTKAAYQALPKLVETCRQVSAEMQGQETVLTIFQHADEWLENEWPAICAAHLTPRSNNNNDDDDNNDKDTTNTTPILAVIEFHHMLIGNSHKKEANALGAAASHGIWGLIFMGGPSLAVVRARDASDLQAWLVDCKKAGKQGQCVYWRQTEQHKEGAAATTLINNKLKVMPYAPGKDTKMDTAAYQQTLQEWGVPLPLPACPPLP